MENQILPVLDTEKLQAKANEYAMKGAEDALKEFYSGYSSPYKKAIEEKLIGKGLDSAIEIPDIIGILNESISKEIDMIANNAVSKSFVPMIKEFLTRAEAEINLSDLLKEFIGYTNFEYNNDKEQDDYRVEILKEDGSFTTISVSDGEVSFEIHFYQKSEKGADKKVCEIYTLPHVKKSGETTHYGRSFERRMKLSIDNVTLEMPFTAKVLEDKFTAYIAKLIIANTKVTFDTTDFYEDMFPERGCHC